MSDYDTKEAERIAALEAEVVRGRDLAKALCGTRGDYDEAWAAIAAWQRETFKLRDALQAVETWMSTPDQDCPNGELHAKVLFALGIEDRLTDDDEEDDDEQQH